MTLDKIDGQKVKNVMIIVELENGESLIARPSKIGEVDEIVTLKDLQRLMSNTDTSEDIKFMSPFVFALDLQGAARKWINELEEKNYGEPTPRFYRTQWAGGDDCGSVADEVIDWIKYFFNLEE